MSSGVIAKFKVGDVVRCIPGGSRRGAGYLDGLLFKVGEINTGTTCGIPCYFGGKEGNGVYEDSLELVVPIFTENDIEAQVIL